MSVNTIPYEKGNTEAWLSLRNSMKYMLGGSEIGVVAGHSPYNSPFALFCSRVGAAKAEVLKKKEAIIQGHDGEEVVAARFARETGKKVHPVSYIMTNDRYPHMKASVDRLLDDEDSGLECKTAKDMAMKKYKHGDFPMSYFDQCLLYLAVSEMERWYLAIQVFGTAFRMFVMTRVKEEADRFAELGKKFAEWEEFKKAHYLEFTWKDSEKRFVYEGEGEETLEIPASLAGVAADPDLTEWETKWSMYEAVYFVDEEEFAAAEKISADFCERVKTVDCAMAEWQPSTDAAGIKALEDSERKGYLYSVISQVWPSEELDGSDATDVAISQVVPDAIEGSVKSCDEESEAYSIVKEYVALSADKKTIDAAIGGLKGRLKMIAGESEILKMPGFKVTVSGSSRETASVKAIKAFFASRGEEVPEGMVTRSVSERSVRITEVKKGK